MAFTVLANTEELDPESLPLMERYGLLRLDVDPPDAKTILDGKYLDLNVWLISIRPGAHSLAVQKQGFKRYTKHFEISHGDRLTFNISLEKETHPDSLRLSKE